jgi:primosomal protein N' (replication factor Y)
MDISIGQAVWVPFGEKTLQGIVLELSDYPAVEETREITGIIEPRPFLSSIQVKLAYWISQYYLSPLFDAVALLLPPGFERRALTFISFTSIPDDFDLQTLNEDQKNTLDLIQKQGRVNLRQLENTLGKKKTQNIISHLVRNRLVSRSYEPEPIKAKAKLEPYLYLQIDTEEAKREAENLKKTRAVKRAALLNFLAEQPEPVSLVEARLKTGCNKTVADTLVKKGLLTIKQVQVRRDPLASQKIIPSIPLKLSVTQEEILDTIKSSLQQIGEGYINPNISLLHGVTGSGKTEIYLQALAETIKLGKRGIVLVPEISLTPQTIERFSSRFPGKVAVLHSQLSLGEQFDEWHRIRNGEFDVVIGPRSALFAPQPALGLIVIDEEHEWTYKQQDKLPRYHTRDVSVRLSELTGAVVILGSATPDVSSFYHAQKKDYRLFQLPERITPSQNSPLPEVEVVDLREELKAGNRSMFSRSLSRAIMKALSSNQQVILFLNRRGAATFIQCRNCGFVLSCRRCEVPLTFHMDEDMLVCHHCNNKSPVPQTCPQCTSRRIKFIGAGTQTLEQEVKHTFPGARLLRWDSDATRQKHSHREILDRFRDHKADILIGTQMITKGLDLPDVTLVGVVNADIGLNLPDFRAGERTFQLLSQVAGRAGRGPSGGQVIIQTYSPKHYAIQAAAGHDYKSFYDKEIYYRRQLHNPPFSQLANLVYTHTNDQRCRQEAERMKGLIIEEKDSKGIADLDIIGPAPAFMHRLRGKFRWQLILRGSELSSFLADMPLPRGWTIDIDPVGLT